MSTQRTWWQSLDVKQRLKFVIYALLLINFAHYIGNDVEQAQHTFHSGWRWYDWTSNFATTLDELGWFVLLFLLELETYVLSLDASICGKLSADSEFYIFSQGQVISDAGGMAIEFELAWVDLVEVVVWLFILFFIELRIRLQDRGISSGRLLSFATTTKGVLYGILWCLSAYWAYRGHWIFAWDEALWILGFMAIGMNLSDWRKEIAQSTTPSGATSSN